jgi:hypothetical protein
VTRNDLYAKLIRGNLCHARLRFTAFADHLFAVMGVVWTEVKSIDSRAVFFQHLFKRMVDMLKLFNREKPPCYPRLVGNYRAGHGA